MKRIIVFLLLIALTVPTLFACGMPDEDSNLQAGLPNVNINKTSAVQSVAAMYKVSQPTKVVANTTYVLVEGDLELDSRYEIVTGFVDNKSASVYTTEIESLRSVEDGGRNEEVKDLIVSNKNVVEAIEGVGARLNGGEWDPEGTVWTIGRGRMAIKLDEALIKHVKYENHTLTFDIPQANATKVLGEEYALYIGSDVHVTIVDDGAVVTAIELNYYTLANEEANLESCEMRVKVVYTYDIEKITIE